MKEAEQILLEEMLRHNIKSFTEVEADKRAYHQEMYQVAKHALWEFQDEKRRTRD